MNYKISTYVLLVLLISLIARLMYEDSIDQLPEKFQKDFKERSKILNDSSGELINPLKAKDALDRFAKKKRGEIFYRWKKHSYGYFFGLKKFDEFRSKIDSLDSLQPNGEKIIGIRVYKSMSLNKKGKKYFDVFMIPVINGGSNLPEIDTHQTIDSLTFLGGHTVLNASIPCPNNCSEQE